MPGICGLTGSFTHADAMRVLGGMMERMAHHSWYERRLYIAPAGGVALGQVSLGDSGECPGPATAGQESAAFLDGEVYGVPAERVERELLDTFAAGADPGSWLASLHGIFCGAVWDGVSRRLLLVNDRFGMKPLYYFHGGGRLVFAMEIKALLADGAVPRTLDLQGLVSFFHYGQLLGEHTLFEQVHALPPGVVLEYRPAEDSLVERRYFRLASRRPEPDVPDGERVARLGELFKAAVDRRLTHGARTGLSLSGGLDSRTILAVVDEERFPMTTLCLGVPGCIDQKAARRMAALTASRHCDFILDRAFLDRFEEHLRGLVWLTDGHFLSQVVMMPTLPKYRELGIEVLLRGHAGELLHMRKAYQYSLDPEMLAVRDEARLEAWLLRRLGGRMLEGVEGPLLRGMTHEELQERARVLMKELLLDLGGDAVMVHRVWRLFVTQMLRRSVAMALLGYGSLLRVRLPYLDNDLVDAILASPPALAMDDTLQAHILARYRPAFLGIVNANTGVRIGAGPLSRRFGTFRRRALAKLRVPGYQPYERLGPWLRRELRPLAERILLDSRCLDRGVFEPETVRQILAAHAGKRVNHTYLIMTLLIFELGQRLLLEDGESRPPMAYHSPP